MVQYLIVQKSKPIEILLKSSNDSNQCFKLFLKYFRKQCCNLNPSHISFQLTAKNIYFKRNILLMNENKWNSAQLLCNSLDFSPSFVKYRVTPILYKRTIEILLEFIDFYTYLPCDLI